MESLRGTHIHCHTHASILSHTYQHVGCYGASMWVAMVPACGLLYGAIMWVAIWCQHVGCYMVPACGLLWCQHVGCYGASMWVAMAGCYGANMWVAMAPTCGLLWRHPVGCYGTHSRMPHSAQKYRMPCMHVVYSHLRWKPPGIVQLYACT